jgi:hypothetical protein
MDPIKDKINQILEETKKLVSDKNFEKAIKNLETILVLDPTHEEATYVLKKINSLFLNNSNDKKKTIEIYGYNEIYAINPDVRIFFNGNEIGRVSRLGKFSFEPQVDGMLVFKCSFRSAKVDVKANVPLKIQLSWNIIWGNLIASIVN